MHIVSFAQVPAVLFGGWGANPISMHDIDVEPKNNRLLSEAALAQRDEKSKQKLLQWRTNRLTKLFLDLALHGLPALLFNLSLYGVPTEAKAVTDVEHDARRQAVASRYDRINETLRAQSADWNRIIGTKSIGDALVARRQRFVECVIGLYSATPIDVTCSEKRSAYVEQLKIARSELNQNAAMSDTLTLEAVKLLDQQIERMESGQTRLHSLKHNRNFCHIRTRVNIPLYSTYEKYLSRGQYRRAMRVASTSASAVQTIYLLKSQCSQEAEEARRWQKLQMNALREFTLISFLQAALDPRFVGSQTCVDVTKDSRPLRRSRNANSFSYVCTLLIDREMFLGLDAANRWFSDHLKAMRVEGCQSAIVGVYSTKLDELVSKNFSGVVDSVPGCNITSPPWSVKKDISNAGRLKELMYSAINLR